MTTFDRAFSKVLGASPKIGMRGLQRKEVKTVLDTSRQYKYCLSEYLKTSREIGTASIPGTQLD